MWYINISVILGVILFYLAYTKSLQFAYVGNVTTSKGKRDWVGIVCLLVLSFLIRIILAIVYEGFESDMACFYGWSTRVAREGFSNFYTPKEFSDYPPGYIYILSVIGWIINQFNIEYMTNMSILLIKLPAIFCDLIAAYYIYKIAKNKFSNKGALVCAAIYILNPAIVVNSTIWGQVDSVFTLFVILMCYYIIEKKYNLAIIFYAIGVVIKPQTIIFTPVLLFACFEEVFIEYKENKMKLVFRKNRFFTLLLCAVGSIGAMILSMMPFGLSKAIEQYFKTLGQYDKATVNAYNMWAMFGLNWTDQTETFMGITYKTYGYIFIVFIVIVAAIIYFKSKKDQSKIFMTAAFIIISMFMLSVRMHERYMFPAISLLLLAFLLRPNKKLAGIYLLFSVVHFYNVSYVLLTFPDSFSWEDKVPNLVGFFAFVLYLIFLWFIVKTYIFKKAEKQEDEQKNIILTNKKGEKPQLPPEKLMEQSIQTSKSRCKLTKFDWLAMLFIVALYSCVAFYDLGNRYAPETQYDFKNYNESIVLDLGESKEVAKIGYFLGSFENRTFDIEYRNSDTEEWIKMQPKDPYTMVSVFKWDNFDLGITARYIKLISTAEKAAVREFVVVGTDGRLITPVNSSEYKVLFDEQEMYDPDGGFRSSTYFDEIYHARTAYEYTQGLYSYENTHPPLGKIFIAFGMKLFGVNPFGWRFMGTLFGILMLPFIYLFGKKIFDKTWVATCITTLFAVDFMHFAQTRIATIDVFITFFIIAMYYFMYQYYCMSFYDTSLKRTWIPLGLCGISMGLGVACKVTGVYAGIGLAILFFMTLYRRYREYCYAKTDINGSTNGIEHKYIVEQFTSHTVKTLLFCIVFFVIIPVIIFTLAYIPFVNRPGEGLIERMLENITTMYNYHTTVDATHPYSSWWYEWPIMVRPIWYFSNDISKTMAEGISSFGNPIIWWAGIPAFFYMIYLAFKKDKTALFLVIAYLAQYLPWMKVTRITFIYHYFPCVPFVVLMIMYALYHLYKKSKDIRKPLIKKSIFLYVGIAVVLFVMFYPVLSGHPVSKEYVNNYLRWFDSWVLLSR